VPRRLDRERKNRVRYILQVAQGASQARLERLIEERIKPGSDKDAIDARIWDLFGESWAIMFTDLAGFSRRVAEFGVIHFLQTIHEAQRLLVPCIDRHDGILLKMEGDSMLVIFRRATRALSCAIDMQRTLKAYNEDKADTEDVLLCIGLGHGRVLRIGDNDVFGAEVNAASKLGEDTAKAGEILVTDSVRNVVGEMPDVRFDPCDAVVPGAVRAFKVAYRF
jgi:class 3 adenylate cyclase